MQACTKDHTVYEEAVQRSSPLVKVKAQGVKDNRLHMKVDQAEFTLDMPKDKGRLKRDTTSTSTIKAGECYQAHMILFDQDPYVFSAGETHKVCRIVEKFDVLVGQGDIVFQIWQRRLLRDRIQ